MKAYEFPVGLGDNIYYLKEENEDSDIKYSVICEKVEEIKIETWGTYFITHDFTQVFIDNYDNVTKEVTDRDTFYWTNSRKKARKVADILNKNEEE